PPTATHTLSLHDALPIWRARRTRKLRAPFSSLGVREPSALSESDYRPADALMRPFVVIAHETFASSKSAKMPQRATYKKVATVRSEEHTSELQSQSNLVC